MTTIVICASPPDEQAAELGLLARFHDRAAVRRIPHLYDLPEVSSIWQRLKTIPGTVLIFTRLYPQAAYWILAKHGMFPPQFQVFSFQAMPNEAELERLISPATAETALTSPDRKGGVQTIPPFLAETVTDVPNRLITPPKKDQSDWREPLPARWYPVINRDRCTNCLQCQQFCLFGVYDRGPAGELVVSHPDQCKPGCPACARICPAGAILFPMYKRDPAIAGAEGSMESALPPAVPATSPAFDDLDRLVDQMDQVMQRRR